MTKTILIGKIRSLLSEAEVQILLAAGLLLLFVISSITNIPLALNGEVPYDFPNYYFGGLRFLEGRPIYDFLEDEVFRTLQWHNRVYPADPPFAVIILSPLALMSYKSAWIVWATISVLLFITSIYLTTKELGLNNLSSILAVSIALSAKPFRFLLFTNHFETLVLFLSVLGWILLRKKLTRAALLLWVIAANLKLFPLLWIIGSFRLVGLRRVLEALLLFVVIFILAGVCVGADNFHTFLSDVLLRSIRWYGVVANYSLLSFGYAFNSPKLAWTLEIGFLTLFVTHLLYRKSLNINQLWCSLIPASLLLSPLCWWGYLILVMPCLIVMTIEGIEGRSNIVPLVVAATIVWGWPEMVQTPWIQVTILLSYVPTALLCYLCIEMSLTRSAKSCR